MTAENTHVIREQTTDGRASMRPRPMTAENATMADTPTIRRAALQ